MDVRCRVCQVAVTRPSLWGLWFQSAHWLQEEIAQMAGLCERCAAYRVGSVDRLDLIRQRLADATPGRWVWTSQYSRHPILISLQFGQPVVLAPGLDDEEQERLPAGHALIRARVGNPSRLVPLTPDHPDAKLIADAPTLLRWAMEEIQRLRAKGERQWLT